MTAQPTLNPDLAAVATMLFCKCDACTDKRLNDPFAWSQRDRAPEFEAARRALLDDPMRADSLDELEAVIDVLETHHFLDWAGRIRDLLARAAAQVQE